MNIRMYNCYFGDCFNLANLSGADLLVDFGILNSCIDKKTQENRFDQIYSDFHKKEKDFLLSHYHSDHYNGVIYVNRKYGYKFRNVYIPDIWSFNGCIKAINLVLFKEILDKPHLCDGQSIFDFLSSICDDKDVRTEIHFVQRGSIIQDKYIALWPSEDYIRENALTAIKRAMGKNNFSEEEMGHLEHFSEKLQRIVLDMQSRNLTSIGIKRRIDTLKTEFDSFVNGIKQAGVRSKSIDILCGFENDISIVFQNIESSRNENLLFTGDFGKKETLWTKIENNTDKNPDCNMHSCYHAIKAGHHGTRAYYHSYVTRMNNESILMIPNDGKRRRWNISSDYSLNVITSGAQSICSSEKACEAKKNNNMICTCMKKTIIEPDVYKDIT